MRTRPALGAILAAAALWAGCDEGTGVPPREAAPVPPPAEEVRASAPPVAAEPLPAIPGSDERVEERVTMVRTQIERRGVKDLGVLRAMLDVPRHRFVPPGRRRNAYGDYPLPIGEGQTISQPYIVALMTEAAAIDPGGRVLEVGTGTGYGAAVAARIAGEVYTIEIIPALAESARKRLAELGFANVHVRAGDGYRGWPEKAPFDAVIVTAAPEHVPQPLKDQLREGGKLVIPVGPEGGIQKLVVITRTSEGFREETLIPVRFVPMTGEARER